MRDPYIANGKDISFSANYSFRNIFGISKVIVSGIEFDLIIFPLLHKLVSSEGDKK